MGRVFNRLDVFDVGDHNDTLSLPAEVPIQSLVTRVHSDQVPHLKAHLTALHLQQLELVIGPNRRLVVALEPVTDEAIHNGSLAN